MTSQTVTPQASKRRAEVVIVLVVASLFGALVGLTQVEGPLAERLLVGALSAVSALLTAGAVYLIALRVGRRG